MVRKLALFTAAAALTEQVSALSAHRHLTRDLERRLLEAESRVRELEARQVQVTEVVTHIVTVTGGVAQPTNPPVVDAEVKIPAPVLAESNPQQGQNQDKHQQWRGAGHSHGQGQNGGYNGQPGGGNDNQPAEGSNGQPTEVNNDQPEPTGGNNEETDGGNNGQGGGDPSKGCPYGNASPGMIWKRYAENGDTTVNLGLARTFAANAHPKWAWNWTPGTDGAIDGVDFIPTLANSKPDTLRDWEQNAQKAIDSGAKMLFSMNEPDKADQANMDVPTGVQFYKDHMNQYSGKVTLVAPSVSNGGGADAQEQDVGLSWLKQWVDQCGDDCYYDACNIHWYSEAQYGSTLVDQVKAASTICGGKPVYVTEFSPNNADDQTAADFVAAQLPKLKELGNTFGGYSYFMVAAQNEMPPNNANMLVSGDGLSTVGKALANVM